MKSVAALMIAAAVGSPLLAQGPGHPGEHPQSPPRSLYRNPTTALTLGILIPGAGHVYAGEYLRGFLKYEQTVGFVGIGVLVYNWDRCGFSWDVECDPGSAWPYKAAGIVLVGLGAAAYVASVRDAPRAAKRANERHARRRASAAPHLEVGARARTINAGLRIAW